MINVAIDGPSGAGKSSVAKAVAKRKGYIYVDTGALYRSIGLFVFRAGIDKSDKKAVISCLDKIDIKLEYRDGTQIVLLNGEDVSTDIRLPEISMYASSVSAIPEVRTFLLELQRKMARENDVIMDGRDIGTVILPDATVKIFMFASSEGRAQRRYKELIEKGVETTLEEVLSDMKKRDEDDANRDVAPCVPAEDAIMLDNTKTNLEETIDIVCKIIEDTIEGK